MSSKKINATQIAQGDLESLGKRIEAHLEKMRGYEAKAHEKAGPELRKADDHFNTITQLLAEAKAKCDGGGFKAFKRKYCPDLGRSRIYELLAIGSGKKTIKESRAATLDRVKKHRKVSVTSTVTDTTAPSTRPTDPGPSSTVSQQAELANLVPADQSAEAIKARFATDEPPDSPEGTGDKSDGLSAPPADNTLNTNSADVGEPNTSTLPLTPPPADITPGAMDADKPTDKPTGESADHEHVDCKKIIELAGQARALLQHPTPPNVESVKGLLTKIVRLCEKPSIKARTSEEKTSILDQSLLLKALGLDKKTNGANPAIPDNLSIPSFLDRRPPPPEPAS